MKISKGSLVLGLISSGFLLSANMASANCFLGKSDNDLLRNASAQLQQKDPSTAAALARLASQHQSMQKSEKDDDPIILGNPMDLPYGTHRSDLIGN